MPGSSMKPGRLCGSTKQGQSRAEDKPLFHLERASKHPGAALEMSAKHRKTRHWEKKSFKLASQRYNLRSTLTVEAGKRSNTHT